VERPALARKSAFLRHSPAATFPRLLTGAKCSGELYYGYARVSTKDQDHTGQVELLSAAGAAKVFSEKLSGATDARPELKRAIAALDAGDVLIVARFDRLARSTRDLLHHPRSAGEGSGVSLTCRTLGRHQLAYGQVYAADTWLRRRTRKELVWLLSLGRRGFEPAL
jgi:hypothetical protein